jgi:hypothetical protein
MEHLTREGRMKYLCLIYTDERAVRALTDGEHAAVERQCLGYEAELREHGRLLAVEALQSVEAATTVRVRSERVLVTDGPFAETKEQLAGFYLVDAHDLNGAIRIAAGIPPARLGSVEVRPVRELGAG